MKKMMCVFLFCVQALTAVEPLNELEYQITTEEWSFFNRDSVSHISQEEKCVAILEGQWSQVKKSGDIAYILKDPSDTVLAYAKPYRQENEVTLYFDITDHHDQPLGSIKITYNNARVKEGLRATLFSDSGTPLLEDVKSFFTTQMLSYIPGSEHPVVEMNGVGFLSAEKHKIVNIRDLPYIAQMNIPPELFYMYIGIRKEMINYRLRNIGSLPPISRSRKSLNG